MEASDVESSSTIDYSAGIVVLRYRLTDTGPVPPLYIIHIFAPIISFAVRLTNRVVYLESCRRRDYV